MYATGGDARGRPASGPPSRRRIGRAKSDRMGIPGASPPPHVGAFGIFLQKRGREPVARILNLLFLRDFRISLTAVRRSAFLVARLLSVRYV